jgi:tetratricopeptide (TPR) repeat protein
VERAIIACGHVPVNMKDFPAADKPPADLCVERVRGCKVYVGLLGTRYGSPVRDRKQVSYTELEFETATVAGLKRLVFLLDTDAEDVHIPPSGLIDHEYGVRQAAFRRRVQDSGLVTQAFNDPATLGQLVERSLRELAEARHEGGGDRGAAVPAVAVAGEIPQEPLGFQPRADLIEALDAPGPRTRIVHALTGMRGIGKTHLAAAYARAKVAEGWRLVAWINAEEPGGLLAGLAEAAKALGMEAGDAQAAGRALRHRLEADGERCLLVFDNATDPGELRSYVPATGAARVIITSNQQAVAFLGSGVPVDVFSEVEALTFLATRTGQADAAGAQALAEELGRLPLALAQAAAVIAEQHLAYNTYLERLQRLPIDELLRPEAAGQYPRGVAAAVLVSLENVRDVEACGAVMNLLAALSPSGVRRLMIYAAAKAGLPGRDRLLPALTPAATDEVLGLLGRVSLLTFSVDGSAVSTHRLVMRVIRDNLAAHGSLAEVCEAAVRLLDQEADARWDRWHEDRAGVRELVEQIMAAAEFAAFFQLSDDLHARMIQLRWRALRFLNQLGDSAAQVIAAGKPLLADYEQAFGPGDQDISALRNTLGVAFLDAGRTAEAITVLKRNLAARERILGPDDRSTLNSRSNLASAYGQAGRTAEALTMHAETLAARERVLGPDDRDTLTSRSNLASAYGQAGRTAEALTMHTGTLAARERVLGPDDPDTLSSRNSLASAYWDEDRTDEAITLYQQALAACERILGPGHPDTMASRSNLARAYQAMGREDEARALES